MATPSPLLGLDSACFKLNIEIPLHWKCRISPTCLLLKTLLENVLTLSCNSWIQARKDLPRWQKAASVIGSLITRPLVHIWKDNFTFSVPKAPSQNPFTFPHPYWMKERKCRTDALPRAPSFPQVQPHSAQNSQADALVLVSQEYSWPSKLNQRLHTRIKEFWCSFKLFFTAWNDHSLPFSLLSGVLCSLKRRLCSLAVLWHNKQACDWEQTQCMGKILTSSTIFKPQAQLLIF